jgi:hypothetical protein
VVEGTVDEDKAASLESKEFSQERLLNHLRSPI